MVVGRPMRSRTQFEPGSMRQTLAIGLVNNMSDEALKITERQFSALIARAVGSINVELRLFALRSTRRSPRAIEYLNSRYEAASAATDGGLDALIITGAQPQAARLSDEDYWDELTELIDWAKEHTASTILSCLAAHAAVLHLDGIERRLLPEKCTGVFAFAAQRNHPLVGEQGYVRFIPHSRHNDLLRRDLENAGYDVLTSSPAHGVDIFTKSFGSQFVFLQGHPEYDADLLAREYRRDMGRYLGRETDRTPARPKGYFSPEAEVDLDALEFRARDDPGCLQMEGLSKIDGLAPIQAQWSDTATSFFRSWINMIVASKRRKAFDAGLLARPPKRVKVEAYLEA